jgi:hypothetical protein
LASGYHSKQSFFILTIVTAIFSTAIVIYGITMKNSGHNKLRDVAAIMFPLAFIATN